MNELSTAEVANRVSNYADREITDALYTIGEVLLAESADRASKVDSKATLLVGYGGAIAAFLISRDPGWFKDLSFWAKSFVCVSGIVTILAIFCGARAMFGRHWEWISDQEWFKQDALDHPGKLRRYHLIVMHGVNANHREVNRRKTVWLARCQTLIAFATGSLTIALVLRTLATWF